MRNIQIRNHCLDLVKGIACICVVFMHCEFPGRLGTLVQCASRFCVPFFFMISGYFCYRGNTNCQLQKKIQHIFLITLGATALYVIIALLFGGGGVTSVTCRQVGYWLIFNQPLIIVEQMWFLFALLYDYILFAAMEKMNWQLLSKIFIPIGIGTYIVLAQGAHLRGVVIPNPIYRNFLIEGFPFFSLGYWLHRDEKQICMSNNFLYIMIAITTLLCPIERFLMKRDFGVNIVTFPQVIFIFLYCIKNPGKGENSRISILGLKYSMYVYIFHPMVWHSLEKIYKAMHISEDILAMYSMPLLCVTITILISIMFVNGEKITMKKKKA